MAGSNDTTMTFSLLHQADDSTDDPFELHGGEPGSSYQQNELQELWQLDPLSKGIERGAETRQYRGMEDSTLNEDDSIFREASISVLPIDNSMLYKDMSKMGEFSLLNSPNKGEELMIGESIIGEQKGLTPLKPLMTDRMELSAYCKELESDQELSGDKSNELLEPLVTSDRSLSSLESLMTSGMSSISILKPVMTDKKNNMEENKSSVSVEKFELEPFELTNDLESYTTPTKPEKTTPKTELSPIIRTNSASTLYVSDMTYQGDSTEVTLSSEKLNSGEVQENPDSTPLISSCSSSSDSNADVIRLKQELKAKEHDLQLAATIGKELLETNGQLQAALDKTVKDMSTKIEELEQLNYSQNMKLVHRDKMEKNYVEEMESLKRAIARQKAEHEEFIDSEHNKKVTELKKQLANQQTELEQAQLQAKQQLEQKQQLEELLQEAREQLDQRASHMNETNSEEFSQLHSEMNKLQNEKISLMRDLNEAQNVEEQLQHTLQRARAELQAKEEEIEEKQCQATAYYNTLERVREENQELRVELDLARMESQNMKKKGNSLFSEVEDRRVNAEKEVISYRVKLDALTKQHQIARQHEHTLKVQLSVLLNRAGGSADLEHMQRLQQQLAQARGEISTLNHKLVEAEKQPTKKDPKHEMFEAWCRGRDPNSMLFFEKLLENKNKEKEEVEQELKTKRLLMLAENQKVLHYESKLYSTEKQLEKQKDATLQLKLKVDELRLKYEPDAATKGREVKRIVEKIPIPVKNDKENKPLKETWLTSNNQEKPQSTKIESASQIDSKPMDKELAAKLRELRSTQPISAKAIPKLSTLEQPAPGKVVLKSLQKKSVRLSEDVDVIEVESTVSKQKETDSTVANKKETEVDKKEPEGKGRVRGRQRYTKVNMITNEGDEETNCAQQ